MFENTVYSICANLNVYTAHPTVGHIGSDFIDREARHILSKHDDSQDPLTVPPEARSRARKLILDVFKGKVTHEKIKLSATLDDSGAKREQKALEDLLAPDVSAQSIEEFLNLVRVDSVQLLRWSKHLCDFYGDILQLQDLPLSLAEFLETYGSRDLKALSVFSVERGVDLQIRSGPSIQNMLAKFQQIFKQVKQSAWPQISALPKLSSVVLVVREKIKDKDALQRKMSVLRMVSAFGVSMIWISVQYSYYSDNFVNCRCV